MGETNDVAEYTLRKLLKKRLFTCKKTYTHPLLRSHLMRETVLLQGNMPVATINEAIIMLKMGISHDIYPSKHT